MDPVDIYAKDGQLFTSHKGEEIPLKHTQESIDCTKAQMKALKEKQDDEDDDEDDDQPETEAKKKAMEKQPTNAAETTETKTPEQIAADAIKAERARRKTFSTIVKTAGVTDEKDLAELEEFYEQGMDEKQLKFLASRTIGARAKAVGEGSGSHESDNKAPPKGAEAELAAVETAAGKRFDDEPTLRKQFGVVGSDTASDAYKTARGRYVASARRNHLNEKK